MPKSSTDSSTPRRRSCAEHVLDDVELAHHRRLGDLEDEPLGRQAVALQHAGDVGGQLAVEQVAGRRG